MADKKINQLDPSVPITANDEFVVCQDPVTGKAVKVGAQMVRDFILNGANAGAFTYFDVGVPDPLLGANADVYFDTQAKNIYKKEGATWVMKDSYGSTGGSTGIIRFTSVYGSDGLSLDGLTYTDASLEDAIVLSVKVDATELVAAQDPNPPAFDEFLADISTGVITFGAPLPAGFRITILYTI